MSLKTPLVKLVNTGICLGASYMAVMTFMRANLINKLFSDLASVYLPQVGLVIDETLIKAGFILLVVVFIAINLLNGHPHNIVNIYHFDILLILMEVV